MHICSHHHEYDEEKHLKEGEHMWTWIFLIIYIILLFGIFEEVMYYSANKIVSKGVSEQEQHVNKGEEKQKEKS